MSQRIADTSTRTPRLPLRLSRRRFAGEPPSVKAARDWLRARLTQAGVPDQPTDNALLLLSELASNSLRHASDPADHNGFRVRVHLSRNGLRVDLHDDEPPFAMFIGPAAHDAEHGRGLFLVDAMADRWGHSASPNGSGMFFAISWDDPPDAAGEPLASGTAR
ncbi:ATP-binding protein [Nocardiopsis rhodophaea]|uniref:ATP-binding protein n=1 Tax=Nocardiopsis rhodophaea TaxID=280238 RepID=UPI0031CFAD37